MRVALSIVLVPAIFCLVPNVALGQFWDQGMTSGAARTDFESPYVGTAADQIIFGECLFPSIPSNPCSGPTSWPSSNFYQSGDISNGFWVMHPNDEQWHLNSDGPLGQSHPIGIPGDPGYGFHHTHITGSTTDSGSHLIINTDLLYPGQYSSWQDIPFLSIGAERDRGNNGVPPGVLNGLDHWLYGSYQYLSFDYKIWASQDSSSGGDNASYRHSGVYLLAEWGQTPGGNPFPRGLFINLHEDSMSHPAIDTLYPEGFNYVDWNWPAVQSFFYPGAEWGMVTVEYLADNCPGAVLGHDARVGAGGSLRSYKFHVTKVYRCVDDELDMWSEPFPASGLVDLRGAHWYIEGAATPGGAQPGVVYWMQVRNARMSRY